MSCNQETIPQEENEVGADFDDDVPQIDSEEECCPRNSESSHEALTDASQNSKNSTSPIKIPNMEVEEDDCLVDREARELPVRVAVHVRPLLPQECEKRAQVSKNEQEKTVVVPSSIWSSVAKRFTYDFVFDGNEVDEYRRSSSDRLYEDCVQPLLDGCFQGLNATVLAYGQTGSGKTFTMGTNGGSGGVIPRVASDLFERVEKESNPFMEFTICVSFFEVYQIGRAHV